MTVNTDRSARYLVHCTKTFSRRLSMIRKRDDVGGLAVQKAERLLENGFWGSECKDRKGKILTTTKHGELRIQKCRKYDLGGGYRLITLLRGNILHMMYMGTHDECTRWLEHHRGISDVKIKTGETSVPTTVRFNRFEDKTSPPNDPQEVFDVSPASVRDRELRIIFKGLVDARRLEVSQTCR